METPNKQLQIRNSTAEFLIFYNLDAIISVGYRVNSRRGTQTTKPYFIIRGKLMDKKE